MNNPYQGPHQQVGYQQSGYPQSSYQQPMYPQHPYQHVPYPQGGYPPNMAPYGRPAWRVMPGPVKAIRVLLYVLSGILLLQLLLRGVAFVTIGAKDPDYAVGLFLATAFPIAVWLPIAASIQRGQKPMWWTLLFFSIFMVLFGLGRLAARDPVGLFELGMSIAVIVLVSTSSARQYFRTRPSSRQ